MAGMRSKLLNKILKSGSLEAEKILEDIRVLSTKYSFFS